MATTKKFNKIILSCLLIFMAIFAFAFAKPLSISVNAQQNIAFTDITITNGDFNFSSSTGLQVTPNGWSKEGASTGKNGVINIGSTFSSNSRSASYALLPTQNPQKPYSELDDFILMINAKSANNTNEFNHVGYKSNTIGIDAYSFYKVSIWAKTQENATASIYIDGLGEDVENTNFEMFSANLWTEYRFYIATGLENKNINIGLYLGSKEKNSYNAVFFDHITMQKISGSYFADEAYKELDNRKCIDLRDFESDVITNANFEKGLTGWVPADTFSYGATGQIVSLNNKSSFDILDVEYLGSDLGENNNFGLLLNSNSKQGGYVGFESTSFEIKPYQAYKITVWAKISSNFSGNAYFKFVENDDVKNMYGEDNDFYSPSTNSITINSNTTNELTNNYTPYTFYVKGHALYNTSAKLQLWLGSETSKSKGTVVFDNVTFEKISWNDFDNASTTNASKVTLSTISGSPSVPNGTFNNAIDLDKTFNYPLKPENWTSSIVDKNKSVYGIINTYKPIYDANKEFFGNIQNPKNPSTSAGDVETDVNNILMLYNNSLTYQSVTSDIITTSKQSYQKISFDYKTVLNSTNQKLLYVYIVDDEDNILFSDEGLYSSEWTKYELLIKSTNFTSDLKIKISLGNEKNSVMGYVFVDNVRFDSVSTMTDELYEEYSKTHKVLDFSYTNFGFISPDQKFNMYTPYRYNGSLEYGDYDENNPVAYGGIIDGTSNNFNIGNSSNHNDVSNYLAAFRVDGHGKYTLQAKDKITLESGNYYKFSVDVQTRFFGNTEQNDKSDEEKAKFGAIFSIEGLTQSFQEIKSMDHWTTYTIYVEVQSNTEVNFKFGIFSESGEIKGFAFFDGIKFETIDEKAYKDGVNISQDDNTVLAITKAQEEENNDENNDNNNTTDKSLIWYLIPSLILFAALVIALGAYFMKKVTIKKWEKKKASEYDRNSTLYRDVIRKEAEEIRDAKIKEVENQINEIKAELERIENIHKENVKQQRTSNGEISRSVERDFKNYAKQHTKLENKIESLEQQIKDYNMPEYLLSVQSNIRMAQVRKERQKKEEELKRQKEEKRKAKNANK